MRLMTRSPKPLSPQQSQRPRRPPSHAVAADAPRQPSVARLLKIRTILAAAEHNFAQLGFEGASLEIIAQDVGISRHNLLYYFPSKEALYREVLDDVLTQWLQGMSDLLRGDNPASALRTYIAAKLASSRDRPSGAKVFAKEIMAGAPYFADAIRQRVAPALREDVAAFARWADEGKIARVDFTHLLFILWSVTQAYAEQQAQFALLLGKRALDAHDFGQAEELLSRMVLATLQPAPCP